MEDSRPGHTPMAERLRDAAEAEGVRARADEWRGRSERERSETFVALLRMSVMLNRNREQPYVKPPLSFPRFSTKR